MQNSLTKLRSLSGIEASFLSIKICLFAICAYSVTSFASNPNQLKHTHTYSDLQILYFTNCSLYLTLITVSIGFIYRFKNALFEIYNLLIPLTIILETLVTISFWTLYAINPALIVNKNNLIPGNETPLLQELGLHFFPLVLIIIDQWDVPVEYRRFQFATQACFMSLWYIVITLVGNIRGKYIYPFLNKVPNDFYRFLLFCVFLSVIYGLNTLYLMLKTSGQNLTEMELNDIKIENNDSRDTETRVNNLKISAESCANELRYNVNVNELENIKAVEQNAA